MSTCVMCDSNTRAVQAPGPQDTLKSCDWVLLYSLVVFPFGAQHFLHPALSQEQVLVKQAFCLWPVAKQTTTSLAWDKEVSV